ncbi:MAG TPA: glycosyltransferase family 4 protein [Verrucomicrobiae bacterium]
MKILILVNIYPPHHAGTYDFRCEQVASELRKRGHGVLVLTSNHGLKTEQRDKETIRRLHLNGIYGHPKLDQFKEMKDLETHNHEVLRETLNEYKPDLVYVWSLHGLSKSLIFTLHQSGRPLAYDVSDYWITNELNTDPWLDWWNRPKLSMAQSAMRSALEMSKQRDKMDEVTPTRDNIATKRLSHIYDTEGDRTASQPGSIQTFRFEHISFVSQLLCDSAIQTGYHIGTPTIMRPGINVEKFLGDVRPPEIPATRLMVASKLHKESGVRTVVEAFKELHDANPAVTLTVCGSGESEYVASLKSFATRNKLPITFDASIDQANELPRFYRQHDFFIHCAEWAEPYTTTPLEAMAAGMMVLSTGYGGVGEVLQHGVNSLLYSAGNVLDLAQRIQYLQNEPAMRLQMAVTGQQEVKDTYTTEAMVNRVEAFLLKAAKG